MLQVHERGPGGIPWVVAVAPDDEESGRLTSEHGVPAEMLAHALDRDELPRLDHDDDAILAVLRVPRRNLTDAAEPYSTETLSLVLTKKATVLVARSEHETLKHVAEWIGPHDRADHSELIARSLHFVAAAFMAEVRHIDAVVDRLESRLRRALENSEVLSLLKCQKGLVYFATALESTVLAIERLPRLGLQMSERDEDLFSDALVEIRQALSMTRTSANVLSDMMDAFASIISNNLNVVMKFLASITIVLTLPAAIATFYGMNVGLPGARAPWAFGAIVAGSLVLAGLVALLFRRLRWL